VTIAIYSKSKSGAKFTVVNAHAKAKGAEPFVTDFAFKHEGGDSATDRPTNKIITPTKIQGPVTLKVKADTMGSRWSSANFLVVYEVYEK